MENQSPGTERRSFLTSAKLAALAAGGAALASGKPAPIPARWEAARHERDDWLDKPGTKHRLVFDTTRPDGLGEALAFAANYMRVNKDEYGVSNNELAVMIVVRHMSTPFGYNDAIWAKYGALLGNLARFEDPKTKAAPKINVYMAEGYDSLPSRGVTMEALNKQGVVFGVCSVATRGLAGMVAQATGGTEDAVNSEFISNLVPGARMVPAGIVIVSRAQERGYTAVHA
jgi:intracellular sulfur oxidation DsrE/DsrF family protein